jgi:hypothetical protein
VPADEMLHRPFTLPGSWLSLIGAGLLSLSLLACSDAGDAPGDEVPETGPLYIGTTRVFTADASQGYMYRFSSLDAESSIDLARAVELEDAWVFGDAKPYFYTATIFSPTITQWSLDERGDFVQHERVSFANEGVTGTYSAAFTPVFSEEKSYFVDSGSAQVVVWNPKDMTFTKTIAIDVDLPEDHPGPADLTPTLELSVQEDRILVNVFWNSSSSGWAQMGVFARLVVIDPSTDEVVEQTDDSRCQALSPVGTTSRGTTYYTPWDYHAAARQVFGDGFGSASCALRVGSRDSTFDESFLVDLSEVVGGRPAGSAVLVDDETMLLHVWHEELSTATPENWTEDGRWQSAYQWYRWKVGEERAELLPAQEPSGEGGTWTKLDGRLFSYAANSEYSETTLVELNEDGTTSPRVRVPGWSAAAIRAR